jgi:hypothetical protein
MKTLFLSAILVASAAAVYADDAKGTKDAKPQQAQAACCSAKTSTQAKPLKAVTTASAKTSQCSDCCKEEKVAKQVLLTPRALAAL